MGKRFVLLCFLFCFKLVAIAQDGNRSFKTELNEVREMVMGMQKYTAVLALLERINLPKDPSLDQLVEEALVFTNRPQLSIQRANLLLANAERYYNAGDNLRSKEQFTVARDYIAANNIFHAEVTARMALLTMLLGNPGEARAILTEPQSKSRGAANIRAMLISADVWWRMKEKSKATALLTRAAEQIQTSQEKTDGGHLVSQLIIQSVRLKQYKDLDAYYVQLRGHTYYRHAHEYILAQGVYFNFKKRKTAAEEKFRTLHRAFLMGSENEFTVEGMIRLAAILSENGKQDSAGLLFDLTKGALNKNLALQPVGVIFNELYKDFLLQSNPIKNKEAVARLQATDSAYLKSRIDALQGLIYQNELQNSKQKIKILEQQKELVELQRDKVAQRNWLITLSAILLVVIAGTVVWMLLQRRKQIILLHNAEKLHITQQHKLELTSVLANAQETERSKIAEKLHDEIGSMLAVVRLNLSANEGENKAPSKDQIDTAAKVLNDVAHTVREMSHELMPVLIHKLGLKKAVEQLIEDINTAGKVHIETVIIGMDETAAAYGYEFKVNVYRIVQELLHNILKHSRATHVSFQLLDRANELQIIVEDNGVGMDHSSIDGKGIQLIQARINNYHGEISIESNPQSGTMVLIEIPINQEKTTN